MPELNYEKAILRVKQTLNSWQHRYLTPIGKITVIKTLILSKFTHLFLSVSTPPHLINTLNKLLFSYIWDGKPDKINRQQICKKISDGGLAMIHVYNFERSLKIRWVKHIISGRNCAWLTLLNHEIKDLNKLALLGGDWLNHRISNLNPFWKTVFSYFMELCRKVKVHSRQDIVSSSLWFNTHIGTDNLFFPDWFKHGIYSIGDIIHTNGNILSLPEMKNRYNFSINFLNYFTVKKVLQNFITLYQQSNTFGFQRPFIPFHIKDLLLPGSGHKSVYFQLQQKINKPRKNELKWCLELDIVQDNDFWKQVYKICFCAINDNEYIWFQYRILYRILGVNELLVKMENAENDTCRLCHCHVESPTHLFSECTVTNALWNNVVSWIETKISIKLHLDKISKTLGYLEQDNFFWPLNFFLTITRYYIFTCAYKHQDPNIYCLHLFIYLFGVLRRFQHCTGHITTGSWKGRGNQYIEFARVVYCKLPTNGKQLPAFPLKAVTGIEPPTSEVGGKSVQNTMKQKFFEQEMLSRVNNTNERFEKTWSRWCKILKNDTQ